MGSRRRGGHGRHAPGGRAHVPRLPRRLLRPAAQPGGQAAVHDRRGGRDGAHRSHPVRGRSLLGQPALPEPRGAAGPHPRTHRGHAVDAGRHLRPAAGRRPGPQPGGVHREPAAVRHEGTEAARRLRPAHRRVDGGATGFRRHGRLGLADGPRGAGRRRAGGGGGDFRGGGRPPDGGPHSTSDPILESVHKTGRLLIAHEAVRPLRDRRRDRRHRGPGGVLGSRRARSNGSVRQPSPAPYSPELEQAWLPDRNDIADAIRRLAAV